MNRYQNCIICFKDLGEENLNFSRDLRDLIFPEVRSIDKIYIRGKIMNRYDIAVIGGTGLQIRDEVKKCISVFTKDEILLVVANRRVSIAVHARCCIIRYARREFNDYVAIKFTTMYSNS